MVEKRLRKGDAMMGAVIPPVVIGPGNAPLLVLGWGSTYHVIREAVENIGGDRIAFMHLQQVYPLPPEVETSIGSAQRAVVIEGNATSQLGRLIRSETGLNIPDRLLKYNGMQFSVEEVQAYLEGVLEEVG